MHQRPSLVQNSSTLSGGIRACLMNDHSRRAWYAASDSLAATSKSLKSNGSSSPPGPFPTPT